MNYSPVALFVYNRPWHTRRAVEALQANTFANETPLYIFSDAPRDASARQAVDEVRSYVRGVTGFKQVVIVERESNMGLARSIIEGVGKLCDEYGRAIVLEDDLVTAPNFLRFMNDALDRYESDERVMQIAGYMFPVHLEIDEDALFMTFISSWGWATWQRSWRQFDPDAKGYDMLVRDRKLRKKFDLDGHYRYFRMLQAQQQGKAESWAIRWYLSVFMLNGLTLYPRRTLVQNLGFDGSGVNCAVSVIEESPLDTSFEVRNMPQKIEVSEAQADVLRNMPSPRLSISSIITRLLGYLKRIIR